MIYMAKISRLSFVSMAQDADPESVEKEALQIAGGLLTWWQNCPPVLQAQKNDWRRENRPIKLTVPQTLAKDAASSTISCWYGCILYLNHIVNPNGHGAQPYDVTYAIEQILEIA